MKKFFLKESIGGIMLSLALAGCGTSSLSLPQGIPAATHGQLVGNRLLVKFRPGKNLSSLHDSSLSTLRDLPRLGLTILSSSRSALDAVRSLSSDPSVDWAEADKSFHAGLTLDDPRNGEQYGNEKIDLPQAWDLTMGDESVVVAVVDTGVDLTHPDLRDRLTSGTSFVEGSQGPLDDNGHGTHVAGIIAASANNGVGVAGVAPLVRIMPVKVLKNDRFGRLSDIVSGIAWAVDHGADVINLSLGSDEDKNGHSKAMDATVRYAISRNVTVVAAMGNMGINGISYPAGYAGVIAVGASDERDERASFSSYGKWISVCAPGVGILSTTPTYDVYETSESGMAHNYDYLDGTSMATPFVSGVAALVLSRYPNLPPTLVKARIEKSADSIGLPGFDSFTGFGRINAFKALR